MVSDDAVAFLGHPPVERPQPRFQVRQRQAVLRRGECPAEGGVRVAVYQHPVGPLPPEDSVQPGEDAAPSARWPARADAEIELRGRDAEVGKNASGQQMCHNAGRYARLRARARLHERPVHRRELHELRPRPDHAQYPHAGPPRLQPPSIYY